MRLLSVVNGLLGLIFSASVLFFFFIYSVAVGACNFCIVSFFYPFYAFLKISSLSLSLSYVLFFFEGTLRRGFN